MEKDAFLRGFLEFRFAPGEIPADWMTEAWDRVEIRRYLTDDMTRMVSKTGEISYTREFGELLRRSLTCDQAVQLYRDIRDNARRNEDEWRPQFAQWFPQCVSALPRALADPYHDWYLQGRDYPREWMDHAWSSEPVRRAIVCGMAASIDAGDERWCGPEWLELLDRSLSRDQIVLLFADLRRAARRPEAEWRWIYEEEFPDCAKYLPPPAGADTEDE